MVILIFKRNDGCFGIFYYIYKKGYPTVSSESNGADFPPVVTIGEGGDALARHAVPDLDGAVRGAGDVPFPVETPLHAGDCVGVLKRLSDL